MIVYLRSYPRYSNIYYLSPINSSLKPAPIFGAIYLSTQYNICPHLRKSAQSAGEHFVKSIPQISQMSADYLYRYPKLMLNKRTGFRPAFHF